MWVKYQGISTSDVQDSNVSSSTSDFSATGSSSSEPGSSSPDEQENLPTSSLDQLPSLSDMTRGKDRNGGKPVLAANNTVPPAVEFIPLDCDWDSTASKSDAKNYSSLPATPAASSRLSWQQENTSSVTPRVPASATNNISNGVNGCPNAISPFTLTNRFKRKRDNKASTFDLQHNAKPLIGQFGGCPWINPDKKYDLGVVG